MIKASALCLVKDSNDVVNNLSGLSWFIRDNQNMVVESVKDEDEVPPAVSSLAIRLLDHDEIIRTVINDFRMLYTSKKENFHLSLSEKSKSEKEVIIHILQDMYGIVSFVHYTPENEILNGKLIFSPKAQLFINGKYLEIAVYQRTLEVVESLSKKYNKQFKVYQNVRVATKEGMLKNEFDLVIEFDGIFYVLEIKSGKNFREFDKYMYIGREYKIVPGRFLLVNNYFSDDHAAVAEYFCDYYVSNLTGGSLENKITMMIERDINGGNEE